MLFGPDKISEIIYPKFLINFVQEQNFGWKNSCDSPCSTATYIMYICNYYC